MLGVGQYLLTLINADLISQYYILYRAEQAAGRSNAGSSANSSGALSGSGGTREVHHTVNVVRRTAPFEELDRLYEVVEKVESQPPHENENINDMRTKRLTVNRQRIQELEVELGIKHAHVYPEFITPSN